MRRYEDCFGFSEFSNECFYLITLAGVETFSRFIEDEDIRISYERSSKANSLSISFRESLDDICTLLGEPCHLENF
jgi:hypothetical protein